jgi:hypothetical protein
LRIKDVSTFSLNPSLKLQFISTVICLCKAFLLSLSLYLFCSLPHSPTSSLQWLLGRHLSNIQTLISILISVSEVYSHCTWSWKVVTCSHKGNHLYFPAQNRQRSITVLFSGKSEVLSGFQMLTTCYHHCYEVDRVEAWGPPELHCCFCCLDPSHWPSISFSLPFPFCCLLSRFFHSPLTILLLILHDWCHFLSKITEIPVPPAILIYLVAS